MPSNKLCREGEPKKHIQRGPDRHRKGFFLKYGLSPKSLLDREKSAAAEITFHLQRKNFHQIQLEVEDLIDLTSNLEPNQYEYEDDDLPF